jgi:hypothetical protein
LRLDPGNDRSRLQAIARLRTAAPVLSARVPLGEEWLEFRARADAELPVGAVQVGLRILAALRHSFRGTFGRRYEKRR